MRITGKDLIEEARLVNERLEKVDIRPERRYGYTALDLYGKDGRCLDTLATGLTRRQAYEILRAIAEVLWREGRM